MGFHPTASHVGVLTTANSYEKMIQHNTSWIQSTSVVWVLKQFTMWNVYQLIIPWRWYCTVILSLKGLFSYINTKWDNFKNMFYSKLVVLSNLDNHIHVHCTCCETKIITEINRSLMGLLKLCSYHRKTVNWSRDKLYRIWKMLDGN